MRSAASEPISWLVLALIYAVEILLIVGCIALGIHHDGIWRPAAPAPATYLPNGPDTVPNHISCQFRGAEFCHPKSINT